MIKAILTNIAFYQLFPFYYDNIALSQKIIVRLYKINLVLCGMIYTVYLLSGSNIGDSKGHLAAAITELQANCGKIVALSSVYKTAPWGNTAQAAFLNQAIKLQTSLLPAQLLATIKTLEKKIGRMATEHWGPRVIDIDILFYKEISYHHSQLHIPHKEICNRLFALLPLAEIAAAESLFPFPIKISTLLSQCADDSKVELFLEV